MQILKLNDTGSLVELIQLALNRSGFLSTSPDGIFGQNTQEAVINFQTAFSLTPDGIVGEKTLNNLKKYIEGFYKKTISKGDTLWSIAAMTGSSVQSIITANPDIEPNSLTIGTSVTVPFSFEVIPTDITFSYYLTELLCNGLLARYPFITKKEIGKSVMGKSIFSLTAGTGDNQVFINAGFHSNEWLNIPVVLRFMEEYMKAVAEDKTISGFSAAELYKNTTLHLVPLVNPDGLDLVTNALNSGEYYEKAKNIASDYPDVAFPSGWKANINGVDLNLQYPAGWEKAKAIKFAQGFTRPSPIEYVGSAPLSQPEAQAIFRYTLDNNFRLILAYHSQGNIIYWKYGEYLPPESERIAIQLSEASSYPLELTPPDSSFAGYKDWFIQDYNRPGYTIETGNGKNPLPLEQFDSIYEANKPLIATALWEAANL